MGCETCFIKREKRKLGNCRILFFQPYHWLIREVKNVFFFHLILTDTDECALANGGCEHSCSNADGSYTCSCNSGFKLNANGLTCEGKHKSRTRVTVCFKVWISVWDACYSSVKLQLSGFISDLFKYSVLVILFTTMHILLCLCFWIILCFISWMCFKRKCSLKRDVG